MSYHPINLNREFAHLNRMALGLLGHPRYRHGFWPANRYTCCATESPETGELKEGEAEGVGSKVHKNYLRPHFHADLDEEKDIITLKAEMPGVEKKHLELEATASLITLKAESDARSYEASVPLRYKIDPKSARASLKAGLLEIELKLAKPLKEKATKIKVE